MTNDEKLELIRKVFRDRGYYHLAANDSLCQDLLDAGAKQFELCGWQYLDSDGNWQHYESREEYGLHGAEQMEKMRWPTRHVFYQKNPWMSTSTASSTPSEDSSSQSP